MYKDIQIFENVLKIISSEPRKVLNNIEINYKKNIEEIRLRNNMPLSIYAKGRDYFVDLFGKVNKNSINSFLINNYHIKKTFDLITNHSVYAFSEEIKSGFITIKGGHRVGIAGKIIYNNGKIENIVNISSLNIRIAREKKGISDGLIYSLVDNKVQFLNTLIISPPQCGKTTLIRDITRNLSNGYGKIRGFKIGLVDERGEISGIYQGVPQKDIGIRTDILDGCKKHQGIMMLIRSMSPEIIVVDEIGGLDDTKAIEEALRSGVKLIASIHGNDLEDIKNKINLEKIIEKKIFDRYIILDNSQGVGTIREILDGNGKNIFQFKKVNLNGNF